MDLSIYLTVLQMGSHVAGAGFELYVVNDSLGFPTPLPLPPQM